ncbi:MAG: hypothetical protein WCJ41_22185, partial [Aestuariivirga sp.]|uniref:hypothetical protein n=1 Tax=Aestuariivirga sp. TaxID=2650926 RepID=UPI00301B1A28
MMAINSRASILVVAIACLTACHQKVTPPETVFPGEHWVESKPDQVGLDKERLKEFSTKTGGSGCVTRYGHLVHSWGHPGTAIDPGSVVKVIFSHLVQKSVKDGELPSLDATAVQHEPALAALNASLGHKDARITWRHFLNQTACYGQTEEPGTAFDYNDFTMVLA